MIIAINGSRHQEGHLDDIRQLLNALTGRGIQIVLRTDLSRYLLDCGVITEGEYIPVEHPADAGRPDAVISLGGDGTLLRTAQWVGDADIPVLGINTGHLGFLANYRLGEPEMLAEDLLEHRFVVEERVMLRVESEGLPIDVWPYVLNEVAILKADTASMINVHVDIDGMFLADYLADGLLVSTPTGSTGYNLSVGGPILQPTLDCLLISPVAPHSLTMRPIVVESRAPIRALTTSRADFYRLSLDGRSFELPCGSEVTIDRAPFKLRLLRRSDDNFASTLRDKLRWAIR